MRKFVIYLVVLVLGLLLPRLSGAQPGLTISRINTNVTLPDTLNGVDSTMAYFSGGFITGNFGFILDIDTVGVGFPDSITVNAYPRVWDYYESAETDNKRYRTLWSEGLTLQLAGGTDKGTAITNWTPVADAPRILTHPTWWDGTPVLGWVVKVKNAGAADTCRVRWISPMVQ